MFGLEILAVKKIAALVATGVVTVGAAVVVAVVVITAATSCPPTTGRAGQGEVFTTGDPGAFGDLGRITGPVGGPVKGQIKTITANIPNRTSRGGFVSSLGRIAGQHPDFITLNEVSGRSLGMMSQVAPGYGAWRDNRRDTTRGGMQALNNVVMWRTDTWTKASSGRVKFVDDDRGFLHGHAFVWDRYATWAMFQRDDGAVVSVISAHHMTNPAKFPRQHGKNKWSRAVQYGRGMNVLIKLINSLSTHGPVLMAGDMNSHANYTDRGWSAAAKMRKAGYGWANHGVDFVFYPAHQGVRLGRQWNGAMASDHHYVGAILRMNRAGPTQDHENQTHDPDQAPSSEDTYDPDNHGDGGGSGDDRGGRDSGNGDSGDPPPGDVVAALKKVRLEPGGPTLTNEQANNAITIAQVASDLKIIERGLIVALATAIQESTLKNLDYGDRDSLGLFQQRPSAGWGTPAQVTDPVLAARAFFGRARHTNNQGLLDIVNWQDMTVTQAAQAVQVSGYPDAYAQWEPVATELAGILGGDLPELTGESGEGVPPECTCQTTTPALQGAPEDGGGIQLVSANVQSTPLMGQDQVRSDVRKAARHAGRSGVIGWQELGPRRYRKAVQGLSGWATYMPAGPRGENAISWSATEYGLLDSGTARTFTGEPGVMGPAFLTWVVLKDRAGREFWVIATHNVARAFANEPGRRPIWRQQNQTLIRTVKKLQERTRDGMVVGDFNRDKYEDPGLKKLGATYAWSPRPTHTYAGTGHPEWHDYLIGFDAKLGTATQFGLASDHDGVSVRAALFEGSATDATGRSDAESEGGADSGADCDIKPAGDVTSCPPTGLAIEDTLLTPDARLVVRCVAAEFGHKVFGGTRDDPGSDHHTGRAIDIMIDNYSTARQHKYGNKIAAWVRAHAAELGVTYVIWSDRIWSVARNDEGWRPYDAAAACGDTTDNCRHRNHVHVSVEGNKGTGMGATFTGGYTWPLAKPYRGTDNHNWGGQGSHWSSWHTGTDFSVGCGTPVLAANSGTVSIEASSWAGPQLVKVSEGPGDLTTWYAHMQEALVEEGDEVKAGQMIGRVGTEGNSTGCHLHFEVHTKGGSIYGPDNVNPSDWLAQNAAN